MANTFEFKVFTPAGAVLEETVQSVTLQNSEGEIGLLPGHTRYISLLGTGILKYTTAGGETTSLVASEGFCHFVDGVLIVMADTVDRASDEASLELIKKKETILMELQSANFFDAKWDVKTAELKRIEALEKLRS